MSEEESPAAMTNLGCGAGLAAKAREAATLIKPIRSHLLKWNLKGVTPLTAFRAELRTDKEAGRESDTRDGNEFGRAVTETRSSMSVAVPRRVYEVLIP